MTTATHTVRRAADRGRTKIGWLDSRHTFSFGSYYDPEHMGFRDLRVINEDRVVPAQGFGPHPHRDMEIISYVVEGQLAHQDSTGTGSVLGPRRVQLMSAGRGIVHSEMNPSPRAPVHFLQIWIQPHTAAVEPRYQELAVPEERDRLHRLVSPDGRDGSLTIHQQASLRVGRLNAGARLRHRLETGEHAWIQMVAGRLEVAGERLEAGDGLALSGAPELELHAHEESELLLFELA